MGKGFETAGRENRVKGGHRNYYNRSIVVDWSITYYTTMGFSHCSSSVACGSR